MINFHFDKHKITMFGMGAALGLAAGILFTVLGAYHVISETRSEAAVTETKLTRENEELKKEMEESQSEETAAETSAGEETSWELILVNEDHPLDSSYVPEKLTEISSGYRVDDRIVADLKQMLDDGAAEGLSMYVTSAYRSYKQQIDTFNASMQTRLNQGMTPLEAYQETSTSVALPGTSEHATGLAVDIISTEYEALDDRQGDTKEQKWLMEHCWEYGFILRYPPEKSDITGIIYEPWHYRYVGKGTAKEITEMGVTLEEYLQQKETSG